MMILLGMAIPVQARAQADADVEAVIFLHPSVATILYFPDEIVDAWIKDAGEIRVARKENEIAVRPRPGTAAGVEASLEVHTRTMHRSFRLRVVTSLRKAHLDFVVQPDARASLPVPAGLSSGTLMTAPTLGTPVPDAPAPSAPAPQRAPEAASAGREPDTAELAVAPAAPEPATATTTERAARPTSARPFELSVHAFAALAGTTELTVPGYQARQSRQPHRAGGLRVAGRRPGASWGVEASVSGEWPVAPTVHADDSDTVLQMRGPWLRADVGLKMWFGGTGLVPTAGVALGLQAHHRDRDTTETDTEEPEHQRGGDMPFGGVVAASMGLEYRMKNLSLGLELHVRQGVPAEYRSVSAVLSVGWSLDQGERTP